MFLLFRAFCVGEDVSKYIFKFFYFELCNYDFKYLLNCIHCKFVMCENVKLLLNSFFLYIRIKITQIVENNSFYCVVL